MDRGYENDYHDRVFDNDYHVLSIIMYRVYENDDKIEDMRMITMYWVDGCFVIGFDCVIGMMDVSRIENGCVNASWSYNLYDCLIV